MDGGKETESRGGWGSITSIRSIGLGPAHAPGRGGAIGHAPGRGGVRLELVGPSSFCGSGRGSRRVAGRPQKGWGGVWGPPCAPEAPLGHDPGAGSLPTGGSVARTELRCGGPGQRRGSQDPPPSSGSRSLHCASPAPTTCPWGEQSRWGWGGRPHTRSWDRKRVRGGSARVDGAPVGGA